MYPLICRDALCTHILPARVSVGVHICMHLHACIYMCILLNEHATSTHFLLFALEFFNAGEKNLCKFIKIA